MNKSLWSKRASTVWAIASRIVLSLVVLFLTLTVSYGLTALLYRHHHAYLASFGSVMTTIGITFLLLILGGAVVGRFVGPRNNAIWQSLIDAIRQMAKGNFDVKLDVEMIRDPGGDKHPFRQLVHSINDMAQELAILEQMRQEFVSDISHEIQSPLTSISGFARALHSGAIAPEDQQRYLEIIESESNRLSRLSDNLLKLTSLESGYHPFHLEKYRLDKQLRDVILSCEPLWTGKELEMAVSLAPIEVTADKDLLSQVWVNMITNAVKFTPAGGTITVASSRLVDEGWLQISISDTGIGMDEEARRRVFERFFKVDKSRGSEAGGGGLGLSIVKKIVDLHGGVVEVTSVPRVGSTFTVSLPDDGVGTPDITPGAYTLSRSKEQRLQR